MKTKSSPLILLATLLTLFAEADAVTGQITFVQSPPRNQQGQQQGQQAQQGLSPDKKKSLSKYGPEDVFPGAREQEDKSTRSSRKNTRPSSAKTVPRTASTPEPIPITILTATPITNAASATPLPPQLAAATPLAATASGNRQAQPTAKNSTSSNLVPIALGAASLLVLGALIYVVGMLRKMLREGR